MKIKSYACRLQRPYSNFPSVTFSPFTNIMVFGPSRVTSMVFHSPGAFWGWANALVKEYVTPVQ